MENPYDAQRLAKKADKHTRKHYGLEILQDIAQLQGGQMDISPSDGIYTVAISVENVEIDI